MGNQQLLVSWLYVIITLAILVCAPSITAVIAPSPAPTLHTYLVHVPAKKKPSQFTSLSKWHASLLAAVVGNASVETRLLYSYEAAMQGFAALLTPQEVGKVQEMAAVEIAFEDNTAEVETTRTPAFLGLASHNGNGPWSAAKQGEDVIIGMLDTGIWPEHPSFSNDDGFSPIPPRWKGFCEFSPSFNHSLCNRKLIGARTFHRGFEAAVGPINETREFKSPRDAKGHGTHTSSIASGRLVRNASLSGAAPGTASGMAPLSRLAMYKVCWQWFCFNSDILAGFDAAINDGVDVISISIGGKPKLDFYQDAIAIGAFAAAANGIITSGSAGNFGPMRGTTTNVAPWMFSVAASSIDRDFPAPAVLGNGKRYKGMSFWYAGEGKNSESLPLVYAGDAVVPGGNVSIASGCLSPDVLAPRAIKGKIVLCDHDGNAQAQKGFTVKKAGGAAMILGNNIIKGEDLTSLDPHILPATLVGYLEAIEIKQYINSTSNPTAHLEFPGTRVGIKPAPVLAAFSSRGPNSVVPEILKPDITAPGLNILAAWTGFVAPTRVLEDRRREDFNILSGTSMACPHVAGVTALLKAAHPTWSPAAIRSALMTTAYTFDNEGKPIMDAWTGTDADPTSYGSGHIRPSAAFEPGLVYDISTQDYVDFLCSLNYTEAKMSIFVSSYNCSKSSLKKPGDLNYPSISAVYNQRQGSSYEGTFTRTFTNVGPANSTYRVSIKRPSLVQVSVEPSKLSFLHVNQKLSYSITIRASKRSSVTFRENQALAFGSLVWSDGFHQVHTPISFLWT